MTWSHSAGVILRAVLSTVMPALLTRMSRWPCCSSTSAMTRSQSPASPMLPWWMLPPVSPWAARNRLAASAVGAPGRPRLLLGPPDPGDLGIGVGDRRDDPRLEEPGPPAGRLGRH